MIDNNKG